MSGDSGATSSERAKNIASGIRSLTIQNLVNSFLAFVFLAVLLRLLSPSDYGLYSALLLVTGIGTSVASFGLQSAATRFVALVAHDEGDARATSRSIVILSLIFTSAATIVFVLLSPALSLYFTKSTGSAWIFAVSGAWLFSGTISGVFQGLVQGMKRYGSLAKILLTARFATVCLTLLGLFEFHSVAVPIIAWVFYNAVICFWSLAIARRGPLLSSPAGMISESETFKKVLKFSAPLGVAGVVGVATGAADPIVVGGLLNQTQLGAYYAAITISGVLGAVLYTPINTAFFPETSSSAHDSNQISNGLRLAFRYTVLALIPASLAVAAVSRQLIALFSGGGASYFAGNISLELIAGFYLFVAMQGLLTSIMLSIGRTTQVMLIGIVTLVLDITLSLSLVPSFGLLGAAASRIVVDIVGFLMAAYFTKNYLLRTGIADTRFYAKVLVISFIIFAVLFSLSTFVSDKTITLIPYVLIGGAILLLCVWGFGLLTEEDERHLEHFIPSRLSRLTRFLF